MWRESDVWIQGNSKWMIWTEKTAYLFGSHVRGFEDLWEMACWPIRNCSPYVNSSALSLSFMFKQLFPLHTLSMHLLQARSNLSSLKNFPSSLFPSTSGPASSLLLITWQFNQAHVSCPRVIPLPYLQADYTVPLAHHPKVLSCVTSNQDPNFHSLYLILIL